MASEMVQQQEWLGVEEEESKRLLSASAPMRRYDDGYVLNATMQYVDCTGLVGEWVMFPIGECLQTDATDHFYKSSLKTGTNTYSVEITTFSDKSCARPSITEADGTTAASTALVWHAPLCSNGHKVSTTEQLPANVAGSGWRSTYVSGNSCTNSTRNLFEVVHPVGSCQNSYDKITKAVIGSVHFLHCESSPLGTLHLTAKSFSQAWCQGESSIVNLPAMSSSCLMPQEVGHKTPSPSSFFLRCL